MYWRRVRENSGDQYQCGHVLYELGYRIETKLTGC